MLYSAVYLLLKRNVSSNLYISIITMELIKVSSLPLKDVISDIAKEFEVEMEKACGMYSVEIPERLGEGHISGCDFDGGMGLIRYDCKFDMDLTFEYSLDKIHPMKFLFCLEGEINHSFSNEEAWHKIPQHKNAMVASSSHHGHRVSFQAGKRTVYTGLEIERRKFQAKMSCNPISIAKPLRALFNDITAKETFYHDGFYSLQISELFALWDKYGNSDFLKPLFLEGLAYKILVGQITQFQDDIKSEGNKTLLRKSELNQMRKALTIIDERLDNMPTIWEIASEVGLTTAKLQQGFRELFGKTVNKFIKQKRLETAKALLLNSDETVTSISQSVGIKSISYFSRIFIETYGIAPSELQKKRDRKKIDPDKFINS